MVVRRVSQGKRFDDQGSFRQVLSLLAIAAFAAFLSNVRFFRAAAVLPGVAAGGIQEKCALLVADDKSTT